MVWSGVKVLVVCVVCCLFSSLAQHYEMMVWYSSDSLLPASPQLPAVSCQLWAGKLPLSLPAGPESQLSVTKVDRKTQSVRLRVES